MRILGRFAIFCFSAVLGVTIATQFTVILARIYVIAITNNVLYSAIIRHQFINFAAVVAVNENIAVNLFMRRDNQIFRKKKSFIKKC